MFKIQNGSQITQMDRIALIKTSISFRRSAAECPKLRFELQAMFPHPMAGFTIGWMEQKSKKACSFIG